MTLRSGTQKSENSKRFLIKDRNDISFSKWMNVEELNQLKLTENFE